MGDLILTCFLFGKRKLTNLTFLTKYKVCYLLLCCQRIYTENKNSQKKKKKLMIIGSSSSLFKNRVFWIIKIVSLPQILVFNMKHRKKRTVLAAIQIPRRFLFWCILLLVCFAGFTFSSVRLLFRGITANSLLIQVL